MLPLANLSNYIIQLKNRRLLAGSSDCNEAVMNYTSLLFLAASSHYHYMK